MKVEDMQRHECEGNVNGGYPEALKDVNADFKAHMLSNFGEQSTRSVGYDGFVGSVIKMVSNILTVPLMNLLNNSLLNGIFPKALEISRINQ